VCEECSWARAKYETMGRAIMRHSRRARVCVRSPYFRAHYTCVYVDRREPTSSPSSCNLYLYLFRFVKTRKRSTRTRVTNELVIPPCTPRGDFNSCTKTDNKYVRRVGVSYVRDVRYLYIVTRSRIRFRIDFRDGFDNVFTQIPLSSDVNNSWTTSNDGNPCTPGLSGK